MAKKRNVITEVKFSNDCKIVLKPKIYIGKFTFQKLIFNLSFLWLNSNHSSLIEVFTFLRYLSLSP